MTENSFQDDANFLAKHFDFHVLKNSEGGRAIVVPDLQGRTMTSSSQGENGQSYGYINYEVFGKEHDPQINLFGGEDRIWISPEGSQFSVFFDPGVSMDYVNWRTPTILDSMPYDVVEKSDTSITTKQSTSMKNMSGFEFNIELKRTVELLSRETAAKHVNADLDGVSLVSHESRNTLTNKGDKTWQKETGLIGLWAICMSKPSPGATLMIPFRKGDESELGTIVTSDYFGKLDSKRLAVNEDLGMIFLLGDGDYRSKLGLSEKRALPFLGSWDSQRGVLTVIQFSMPDEAPHGYTNNLWEYQDDPYCGDAINGYNDGPNETGGKLGGFYELETVSPAYALAPGESRTHTQRTTRIEGDREKVDVIAQAVFGVSLDEVESQLNSLPV
ncbi:DUF6786 family protein [Mariniblastus fucicola]|uniref:Uncharacterized protein n=1 Tax=Mariniblastus fucicola TaxID=980251 RepID=A0A5B9PDX4_9BACT|nr:DUF6786 family protein [Mariniblastus fucicola]QEG21143.1 hypothetical protein MFFC18_09970 [Mariniblastus fucicola]